ncbi:MAG: dioxygenase [Actinobacteria bacterium]|nr:dioxygenase [Actinomycetota bacterium]
MPALYIGHGAPLLLDDPVWTAQLSQLANGITKPKAILVVSAHWEAAPIVLGATDSGAPLIYDFGGFDPKYYNIKYRTPDSSELARTVHGLLSDTQNVVDQKSRGLDHGAYVPLMVMYPDGDIPVVQMSIPTHDPEKLYELGQRLAPLRDQGVMIVGSGFLTHGLPYLRDFRIEATPPGWSVDFDLWAQEAMARADVDTLMNYRELAPGMPYAHPSVEHLSPLFVTLGAASDSNLAPDVVIDGYWMGLAKTSIQVA